MKKTILVVDDSEFDRGLLVKALSKKGDYRLLEASSGERCLELLSSEKVDLILLDILMSGEKGDSVLMKIRQKYSSLELPVIMVTSKSEAEDIVQCLQKGANDYITKPVHFDIAISRMKTHLVLAEQSLEMLRMKELATLDALIVTYNHEINNPLLIAIACLNILQVQNQEAFEKMKTALWRIADIVKKIKEVSEKKEVEYATYAGAAQMIKLNKS